MTLQEVMIQEAKRYNRSYLAIEKSYNELIDHMKERLCSIPFPGEFDLRLIEQESTWLYPLGKRTIYLKKVISDGIMYQIIKPYLLGTFSLYAAFGINGAFQERILCTPKKGFHIYTPLPMSSYAHLCTGQVSFPKDHNAEVWKVAAEELFRSMEVVNFESMGMICGVSLRRGTISGALAAQDIRWLRRNGVIVPYTLEEPIKPPAVRIIAMGATTATITTQLYTEATDATTV